MVTKDEALKMAIFQMKAYGFKHLCDYQCNDKELLEVIKVCEEALERLSNMVAVPLDKLQDMQRRLKALDKMSDNAKELGLDYE